MKKKKRCDIFTGAWSYQPTKTIESNQVPGWSTKRRRDHGGGDDDRETRVGWVGGWAGGRAGNGGEAREGERKKQERKV